MNSTVFEFSEFLSEGTNAATTMSK